VLDKTTKAYALIMRVIHTKNCRNSYVARAWFLFDWAQSNLWGRR